VRHEVATEVDVWPRTPDLRLLALSGARGAGLLLAGDPAAQRRPAEAPARGEGGTVSAVDLEPDRLADERSLAHPAEIDGEPAAGVTWQPRDLSAALAGEHRARRPEILLRTDGRGLLYAGTINGIHSDSGTGKGWVALAAGVERLDAGGHLWWFDFEDPAEHLLIERLRTLGVSDDVIAGQVHYVKPDEPATLLVVSRVVAHASEFGPSLVVIDSVGEALGLQGLDENKDLDVDLWKRLLPHELERAGHTLLNIDHGTKAGDNPLYPSGSKRKRALISGAAWHLELVTPFDREHPGKLKAVCAKDRHGNYRRGETGGWIHVDPTGDRLQIIVEAPTDTDAGPLGAVTVVLVRRVLAALKAEGAEGLGRNGLRAKVRTKGKASNQAIDDATELAEGLGCIAVGTGPRNAQIRRYVRDATDDDLRSLQP
jgi:hypothetical protein